MISSITPLGIRIVLDVFPLPSSQLSLLSLVQFAFGLVAPQMVPEDQHALDLRASLRQHMQVGAGYQSGSLMRST